MNERIFKYGVTLIADTVHRSPASVRRDIRSGKLNLNNFGSVCLYVAAWLILKEEK